MSYLDTAIAAAKDAGQLLRDHFHADKNVDEALHHDLKLELDRKSQDLIFDRIAQDFPDHALYGEEGLGGNQQSEFQWIVDPIDGTVNFFYGIPHFCVSIAMRQGDEILVGVIYDPMTGELWTAEKGGEVLLNGQPLRVSKREKLEEAIVFIGCGKDEEALKIGLERFRKASLRCRKMRMMGSAALGMAYTAAGRLDAYVESRISLWDIAAGKLILEMAGGSCELVPNAENPDIYAIKASNGLIPIDEVL
ncbi:inositol monophosphatase family protein [Roseibacillus ishigakijimensis]|uniref:Inositol-1-monophosphatase n=1 Tax=Roseibacillus ishigakijimensis TaxID=454146 RepID=A0A934RTK3_9BACT|nr:inositol monophosphatase family protein [Roseibacillus ishigakijimensis]MBK1833925.1 inositol monophosphatase [Roseibacillus ishigakijimensis]